MTSPRILFVDHAGVLGGAELYLLDVVRYYGDAATVILFEDGPFRTRLEAAGVQVQVLSVPPPFLSVEKRSGVSDILSAVPGFLPLVTRVSRRAQDHDLVFANSQKALMVAGPAAWWGNTPFVWNLHDMLTAGHFSTLNQRLAVAVGNAFADRIIVNSEATLDAFAESGGDASRCRVVYNGIDPTRFASPPADRVRELRHDLGLSGESVVGVFGRLTPWKGQHVLIEALSDLPDVHALFVGGSLFEDKIPYRDVLRRQAETEGVADRVHFLGFRDDVPRLMHLVDLVVHTSTAPEPFGRVLVEGMLAGCPVIGTRAGGPPEIIGDSETGLLVPPGDPDALATAIQKILSNPQWARSMGEAAQAYARDRFSVDRMQEEVDRIATTIAQ
jgi:glycosyltransferase involved in cell wall biosynthesis